MKRTATFGSLFLSVFTLALWAQAPPQMPKPGPEHQRLHYFVGDWETITEAKPSPFGPGGKITAKDHNVMLGDFFVVFHSDSTGPMGQQKTVAVMGYDPKEKVYTYGKRLGVDIQRRRAREIIQRTIQSDGGFAYLI